MVVTLDSGKYLDGYLVPEINMCNFICLLQTKKASAEISL